jgi:hypothetical protein
MPARLSGWRKSFYGRVEGVLSRAQMLSGYEHVARQPGLPGRDLARYTGAHARGRARRGAEAIWSSQVPSRYVRVDIVPESRPPARHPAATSAPPGRKPGQARQARPRRPSAEVRSDAPAAPTRALLARPRRGLLTTASWLSRTREAPGRAPPHRAQRRRPPATQPHRLERPAAPGPHGAVGAAPTVDTWKLANGVDGVVRTADAGPACEHHADRPPRRAPRIPQRKAGTTALMADHARRRRRRPRTRWRSAKPFSASARTTRPASVRMPRFVTVHTLADQVDPRWRCIADGAHSSRTSPLPNSTAASSSGSLRCSRARRIRQPLVRRHAPDAFR